jgi:hypothetical protein
MVNESRSIKKSGLFKNKKMKSLDDYDGGFEVENESGGGDRMSKGFRGLFFNHKNDIHVDKSADIYEGRDYVYVCSINMYMFIYIYTCIYIFIPSYCYLFK